MTSARILTVVFLLTPLSVFAQGRGGPGGPPPGPPKNLKVLPAGTDVAPIMNQIRIALGVRVSVLPCGRKRFESDDNPEEADRAQYAAHDGRSQRRASPTANSTSPATPATTGASTCRRWSLPPLVKDAGGRGGRGGPPAAQGIARGSEHHGEAQTAHQSKDRGRRDSLITGNR